MPDRNVVTIKRRDFLAQSARTAAGITLAGIAGCAVGKRDPLRPHLVAGAFKRLITPPISIPYLTSSGNGTCAPFAGKHDDLFARALVLNEHGESLAILTVDSIGYDNSVLGSGRDFTRELRKRISRETALKPNQIMLSATHAHSTPETIGLTNFRNIPGVEDWLEQHLEELAQTVIAAWKQRVPVNARFGKTRAENIARNRRIVLKNGKMSRYGALPPADQIANPCPVDEDLSILYLETTTGTPHSILLNFTAHPVVTMLLPNISADYPGTACRLLETQLPGSICLFTQGAAGNINSTFVSTKYEDAEALGKKLFQCALAEISNLKSQTPLPHTVLSSNSKILLLEPRNCSSLAEIKRTAATDPTPNNLRLLRLAQKLADAPLHAEIQVMRIGPVTWIALPGEPFVETGLALKQSGASFVCGYSNGWLGYFPIQRAYNEGGYEVELGAWSRVASGTAEILERSGRELLIRIG